ITAGSSHASITSKRRRSGLWSNPSLRATLVHVVVGVIPFTPLAERDRSGQPPCFPAVAFLIRVCSPVIPQATPSPVFTKHERNMFVTHLAPSAAAGPALSRLAGSGAD